MKVGGWILAIVAAAAAGWFGYRAIELQEELAAEQKKSAELQESLTVLEAKAEEVTELQATVEDMGEQLTTMSRELDEAEQWYQETQAAAATVPEDAPDAEQPAEEPKKGGMKGFMSMFEGEDGAKMRDMAARSAVDMQYAALFKDLILPADVDQQVRDILTGFTKSEMERGMGMVQGGKVSGKEMRAKEEEALQGVREELSQVLTVDEMAVWEEYEANKERHMIEQSFDMQLNMFASGLDDDTRLLVRDTLVNEMMLTQEEMAASDVPMDAGDHIDQQAGVYQRVREQLAPVLAEEQYRQVDNFLSRQEQMMEMSRQMFQGTEAEDAGGSSPAE